MWGYSTSFPFRYANYCLPTQEQWQGYTVGTDRFYTKILAFSRIPDSENILVETDIKTAMPGEGRYRFVATRDQEGTYLMVYAPVGRPFAVNMKILPAKKIKAWWFNPRTGKSRMIGVLKNEGTKVFETPSPGEMIDWILVLDDAQFKYPIPKSEL